MADLLLGFVVALLIVGALVGFLRRFGPTFIDETFVNAAVYLLCAFLFIYGVLVLLWLFGFAPAVPHWRT